MLYRIDAAKLFYPIENWLANGKPEGANSITVSAGLCQDAIQGLCARYNLVDKRIFSIAAGEGFEEYWMWRAGNRLALNDINPAFQRWLQAIECDPDLPDAIDYHLCDLGELVDLPEHKEKHDVCYTSSLHPDEIHREDVDLANREHRQNWLAEQDSFLPMTCASANFLAPGGLWILQSYRGGVSLLDNPGYVAALKRQLSGHGLTLVEGFFFRQHPSIKLLVAIKGDLDAARGLARRLSTAPALRTFHGRFNDPSQYDIARVDFIDLLP